MSTMVFAQSPNFITTVDTTCNGFDLTVDGTVLLESNPCTFDTPQVVDGSTYTLEAVDNGTDGLLNISTLDLVTIQAGLYIGFDNPLQVYKADFDQDGAVSTYDMVAMRSVILGITTYDPVLHVVDANTVIPELDPLDIQADFSTYDFTTADYNASGELKVEVLRIGDVR